MAEIDLAHINDLLKMPSTQKRAMQTISEFYFTNKKCLNGHLSPRYTSSANCRQCIIEKRGIIEKNFRGRSSLRRPQNQKLAEDAHKNGFTTYEAMSPCKQGHFSRYVTTNNCVECNNKKIRYSKWQAIKKKYGLEKEDYESIFNKQNSSCAICKSLLNDKNTHVDHCHSTKKVRGLLCSKCNQGIGLFNEDVENLKNAVDYLNAT